MAIVQYSTKLMAEQVEVLSRISKKTHIPQAVLVRQALDMLFKKMGGKREVSVDFFSFVKEKVSEDKELLKKLAAS